MDQSANILNNGLWLAMFVSSIIGIVALLKMYFRYISPAINPLRGARKAIVATMPSALISLGFISLPGTIFYIFHPNVAFTMTAFPLHWVAIGFTLISLIYLLAGFLLKKYVADPRTKTMIHQTAKQLIQPTTDLTADSQ